ncbi:unnamed protein product [Vicia faba]|uniref:Transferring glycosyl group transferase n=1 Tax=Vicia faba TaxID=3906 RepID=A0AAV1AQU5_VICFA|nr:unnamed protein product [Vicia faba]
MSSSFSLKSFRDLLNKPWKIFLFPTIKSDHFYLFIKLGLTISIIFLISHFFYLSISYQKPQIHYNPLALKQMFQSEIPKTLPPTSSPPQDPIPTNLSHIVFGIGGTYSTWKNRRHYSELWWNPNVTRGFVWLDTAPPKNETWPKSSPPYKVSADTSSFKYTCDYGSRSAIRIARILKETFNLGLDNVRWFVMGDDDTVFFSENLITVLNKYDHNQLYYIGGNSESVEQNIVHFYTMGYGGGGFAISYPLAAELVMILDGCIDRYADYYGSDQKIQSCISEIGVQITKEPGFHQIDVHGSPYGLLAAHPVAPLVSLHHLDYVDQFYPDMDRIDSLKKLLAAYKADPGRTIQPSFCYDHTRNWTVSISWGYSVELYPYFPTAKELETPYLTFKTWKTWSDGPFTINTRPISWDICRRPLIYFLDQIDVEQEKTQSNYKRYPSPIHYECEHADYVQPLKIQYVNVSAPKFSASLWNKAPRRQCCEVINSSDSQVINGSDSVIQVNVRACQQFESVTPH